MCPPGGWLEELFAPSAYHLFARATPGKRQRYCLCIFFTGRGREIGPKGAGCRSATGF
jgi:hypothetical protein